MENKTDKLDKEEVLKTVKTVIGFMNIDCQIETKEERTDNVGEKAVSVSIQTPDSARFLIGKNGQNLKALEHILRMMLVKEGSRNTVVLDVNDYRKSRAAYIIDVAKQAVMRVRNSQKAEALFPMSAYERRIIHMELAAYPDVITESIGSDTKRRIVIKPYL